ncbi:MAG TPA: serine/threonine-protein kinase, partial [Gemmatirosa sp.]
MPQLLDLLTAAAGDRYRVEREIGRGGMGAVFLARDRALDRRVAIKVLPPELATRTDLRERFLRETRTAAAFSHPHIVPVHAVEERDGLLLFVMGYVDGETLAGRVGRAGPLGAAEATRLLREVAWALSYAHSQGVVHRDVKPDNILIERATGRALVTDFGIARVTAGAAGAADALGLTRVGEVVGTPQFMSPEQAVGDVVDGRSDLYALGIVGFFALTGRVPFDGATTQAVLAQQITRPAPELATLRPDVPEALAAAVQRCVAKEPAERFPSGEAMVEALDAAGAAHHDVAPALRLFAQRLETTLRALVILAVLTPTLASSYTGGSVDALVIAGFLLAVMWGIGRGLVTYAGELARKGFRYEDVRAAVRAVDAEQRDLRATLRATPGDAERRRRHWWRVAGAVVVGIGCEGVTFGFLRHRLRAGMYGVEPIGVVLSVLGMALIGGAFVSVVTDPR